MRGSVRGNERDERQFIRSPQYANVRETANDQRLRGHANSGKLYATLKTSDKVIRKPKEERKPKLMQSLVHTNSALREEFMEYLEYYRCLKAGRFDCPICTASLSNRQGLIKHWNQYHSNRRLPKYLRTPPNVMSQKLMAHCKAKHCIICGSQCETMDRIKMHLMKMHGVEIHVCSVRDCSNAYLHKEYLKKHVMEVHKKLWVSILPLLMVTFADFWGTHSIYCNFFFNLAFDCDNRIPRRQAMNYFVAIMCKIS